MTVLEAIITVSSAIGLNGLLSYGIEWIRNRKKDEIQTSDLIDDRYNNLIVVMQKQMDVYIQQLENKDNIINNFDIKLETLSARIEKLEGELRNNQNYLCYNLDCSNRCRNRPL